MSDFEKSAQDPPSLMNRNLPTSQHKDGAYYSQPAPTHGHVEGYESTSSEPKSCYPEDVSHDQKHALGHEDSFQTDRSTEKADLANSSQYFQGSQSDSASEARSSVPMKQSLPPYHPLDAWVNTPINEEPWTALRAYNSSQVKNNRNGEMRDGNMDTRSEGQRSGSGSVTHGKSA